MSKKRLTFITFVLLVTGMLILSGPSGSVAKTIELKFAHPYSPMHPQHKEVLGRA